MSVFTKIIAGDEPQRIAWADGPFLAPLKIAPLSAGHILLVPREAIDQRVTASGELLEQGMQAVRNVPK